ncbi:MAG TPA: PA2778 family cysteine peptidase [Nevskiaceae bacterium]|nr:PA2778 family cysteine peptidase [Nevskiaceae bacterium]
MAVPGYTQQALHCGPAALASLLQASGVPVTPEQLAGDLFIPARGGSLATELVAQARVRGRVPLTLAPRETALWQVLQAGQPVLLRLNRGLGSAPVWHYAVLIGAEPGHYWLHDGEAQPRRIGRLRLLAEWERGGFWALTVHQPAEPPAWTDAPSWMAALAPLLRREPAWAPAATQAAVTRWPESALAWAARGNQHYARGETREAWWALRRAAQRAPGDAAIANNLAHVSLALGCRREAAALLARAQAAMPPPAVAEALAQTAAELAASTPVDEEPALCALPLSDAADAPR